MFTASRRTRSRVQATRQNAPDQFALDAIPGSNKQAVLNSRTCKAQETGVRTTTKLGPTGESNTATSTTPVTTYQDTSPIFSSYEPHRQVVDSNDFGVFEPTYKPKETIGDSDRLWKDYVKEAHEEDRDMLDSWNNNLETLLVFSGLFSAILTAFLIESYKDLRPDPSLAIVTAIQAGFQHINNITIPQVSSLNEGMPFNATARSVRVNMFWFTSLALSLSSAAGAMLARSWLVAYSRQLSLGSPLQRAEKRQKRFDGFNNWRFQDVMDFLPLPLFVSIILFGAGMCDFLYGLDSKIAAIPTIIFSICLIAILAVNLASIFVSDCPYRITIPVPIGMYTAKSLKSVASHLGKISASTEKSLLRQGRKALSNSILQRLAAVFTLPLLYTLRRLVEMADSAVHSVKLWTPSSPNGQKWKARALAWLVQSSSDKGAISNALYSIPASGGWGSEAGPLCRKDILDTLAEHLAVTLGDSLLTNTSDPTAVLKTELNIQALGHSLRLLACKDESTPLYQKPPASVITLLRLVKDLSPHPSQSPSVRLLLDSIVQCLSPSQIPVEWGPDIYWAAEPGSVLGDWLRLFLVQDIARQSAAFPYMGRKSEALTLVCGIMRPVKTTWESSVIFLAALDLLLPDESRNSTTPYFTSNGSDNAKDSAGVVASLLLTYMNSIMAIYGRRQSLPAASLSLEDAPKLLDALDTACGILLRVLNLYQDQIRVLGLPSTIIEDAYPFIKWVSTTPDLSVHSRKEIHKVLVKCPWNYTAGWEGDVIRCCWETVSHFERLPLEDDATLPAITLATEHMLNMGLIGGHLMVKILEDDPDIPFAVVSILGRNPNSQLLSDDRIRHIFTTITQVDHYRTPGLLRVEPINDDQPDEATFLIQNILTKLIEAGLQDALIFNLARSNDLAVRTTCQIVQTIACFPSLARKIILDGKLIEQLASSAAQLSRRYEDRWSIIRCLIQFSYRVREVCDDKEQAIWFEQLINLDFLRLYAKLLPTNKWPPKILWDLRCSLPIMQDLYRRNRDAVVESKVLDVMWTSLTSLISKDTELLPRDTEMHTKVKPNDLLGDLRRLTHFHPDTIEQDSSISVS